MRALAAVAALALLGGCAVDPDANMARCADDAECGGGRCFRPDGLGEGEPGFCIGGEARDGGTRDGGGEDGGPDCVPTFPDDCTAGNQDCDEEVDEDADLTTQSNCGACGNRCQGATPVCQAGSCVADTGCTSPLTFCMMTMSCVNTQTDPRNCGGCGFGCDPGESCVDGQCRCGSSDCVNSNPACCDGVCVNLDEDEAHCGGCNAACSTNAVCGPDGVCRCGSSTSCRPPRTCATVPVTECL